MKAMSRAGVVSVMKASTKRRRAWPSTRFRGFVHSHTARRTRDTRRLGAKSVRNRSGPSRSCVGVASKTTCRANIETGPERSLVAPPAIVGQHGDCGIVRLHIIRCGDPRRSCWRWGRALSPPRRPSRVAWCARGQSARAQRSAPADRAAGGSPWWLLFGGLIAILGSGTVKWKRLHGLHHQR